MEKSWPMIFKMELHRDAMLCYDRISSYAK